MKALSVSLVLGSLLALNRVASYHTNSTSPSPGTVRISGLCAWERDHVDHLPGAFVPQCDDDGNFLPQQCSPSTGYCWCVNTIIGVEIPNTRTPPGVTPVNCENGFYCPYNWTRFGNRCFIFIDYMKTWPEAEGYCLFEKANLASIHDPKENYFIQDLTRGMTHNFPLTWIGGYDALNMNYWMWTDGSPFNYENWAFPPKKMDKCMKMNYGFQKKWISAPCNHTLPFVCAKEVSNMPDSNSWSFI